MNNLNFLREKPLVNWLDFFVDIEKLKCHFDEERPDPPLGVLMAQFSEQARVEEKETAAALLPDDSSHRRSKAMKLRLLAMSCLAALNWDLSVLIANLPLYQAQELMDRLVSLAVTGTELERFSSPVSLLTQLERLDISQNLSPISVFLVFLYCRWILVADLRERFPKPKPRPTVSNPANQPDPAVANVEANRQAWDTIHRLSWSSSQILERWLNSADSGLDPFPSPSALSFLPNSHSSEFPVPNFSLDHISIRRSALCVKIRFELMAHYFGMKKMEDSKRHLTRLLEILRNDSELCGEKSPVDLGAVNGYCAALGFPTQQGGTATPLARIFSSFDNSPDQVFEELECQTSHDALSLVAHHKADILTSHSPKVAVARLCRQMSQGLAMTAADVSAVSRREAVRFLCQVLQEQINECKSGRQVGAFIAYLKLLCLCIPNFHNWLENYGLLSGLGDYASCLQPHSSNYSVHLWKLPTESPNWSRFGDERWQLLCTFNVAELKSLIAKWKAMPFRTPARHIISSSLEPLFARLPHGHTTDLLAMVSGKMAQLGALGRTELLEPMMNLCLTDLGNLAQDVGGTFGPAEVLRLELARWHRMLHRSGDAHQKWTKELTPRVKGFVGAVNAKKVVASAEVSLLVSTFFINTCDWQFIIGHCTEYDSRFMDVSKLLAALCFQLDAKSQQSQLHEVAQTFYDVILPTLEEQAFKRGVAGDKRPVQRSLVTRQQLQAIVSQIKEQTTISVLISFFGKLFNSVQGGVDRIFIEHEALWKSCDATNVNEDFLNGILGLALENALVTNPTNAFYLRSAAEFHLAKPNHSEALRYHLQALLTCTEGLSRPLPKNVVDDEMIREMMKCCSALGCPTAQGVLTQLLHHDEGYAAASKAFDCLRANDASTDYYQYIWDVNLLEFLIYRLANRGFRSKERMAVRLLGNQEMNCHNHPDILEKVMGTKRRAFLSALCSQYF